ncbi:MAG: efflux RND transporter periplasmic adaptor subunit [Blastochloris viridis]|uniref:Efflux RND transporter periplasmic adaptor subunit n=1 Tax=Blastochloris viridis TaxID=1079 RepID=A0A6N4R2Q0_BLAVI|nr:MAG: efflux RND transporter periplasmic adaptor subunit [Blastochloris viridis]
MNKLYLIGGVAVAAAAAWYFWPFGQQAGGMGMGGEPEVSIVTIQPQEVTLTKDLPGRTSAVRVAEIRPQVSGIITKRLFEEGGTVTEGQQLYQIDAAPYKAAYDSAVADLRKAEANVKSVTAKEQRYAELVKIGGVSKQEFDDITASLAQAKADVAIARAALATAKINLDYTKVMSPISGRIGQSNVTEGALVNANQADALAVVQQLDHIYVDVSQSSEEILRLRQQQMAQNDVSGTTEASSPAHLLVDGKVTGEEGTLKFSDVSVNPSTGTVQLRVLFPNPKEEILPGMFVHARLEQWRDENAILIPQKAASRQADGSVSVWVVNAESKVAPRNISVTDVVRDQWLVTNGLKAGEKVIVEGIMKVQPDMKVKTVDANAAPAAKQPAQQPAAH